MKSDLHVHTAHSGMCTVPLFTRICRESYTDPEILYATLKGRGMDLVTVTDHDSIGSTEALRRYPDFFASVEVTCTTVRSSPVVVGWRPRACHAGCRPRGPFVPPQAPSIVDVFQGTANHIGCPASIFCTDSVRTKRRRALTC